MKKIYLLIGGLALACARSSGEGTTTSEQKTTQANAGGAAFQGTLAFVSDRIGGDDELFLAETSRTIRLTENVGRDLAPRWNLAGDKLLFNSRRSAAHGHNRPEIYKIEFPAKSLERMTTTTTAEENQRGAWYPGDAHIVFQRGTYFSPAHLKFVKMAVATKAETLLYEDGDKLHAAPAVSPNGQTLVFQSNKDFPGTFPSRLYTMNLAGTPVISNLVHPATTAGSDIDPRWSHDGEYLVFASARNGGDDYSHIYTLKISTLELTQITTGNFSDSSPDFSPDGKEIVFQSDRNQDYGIHIVNIQTKEVRFVGEGRTPVWSAKTLAELGY